MKHGYPSKVLITGGREIGGIGCVAAALRAGFTGLGLPVEIVSPWRVFLRWRELRDPRILKILSTAALFAAPLARRAICLAHGVPRADYQGWLRLLAIVGSFKLANQCAGAQLVSVSHYTAATLRAVFGIRSDAVVHNPVKPLYLEPDNGPPLQRCYVTYVGRLIATKNLHRILPAIRDLLDETPSLRACIIGEGGQQAELQAMVAGDPRFEFKGTPEDLSVRDWLRRTKIFVSGNEVEGFGIAYLEAMTQGCVVAMPACGGGLEISPDKVGRSVQLLPLSWDRREILAVLRRALNETSRPIDASPFAVKTVAEEYLAIDALFSAQGRFQAKASR